MTIYEVAPLRGVGPVLLGMSREEVHSVMGMPLESYKKTPYCQTLTDVYHGGALQVCYDEENKVEYIELSSFDSSLSVVYKGKKVFQIKADDLVHLIAEDAPYDPTDPELGYAYVFPHLALSIWRPVIPENDSDPEGQYFSTIGVGKRGYYSVGSY